MSECANIKATVSHGRMNGETMQTGETGHYRQIDDIETPVLGKAPTSLRLD